MLKKLALFIGCAGLLIPLLLAQSKKETSKNAFFPGCNVVVKVPDGWFTRNESGHGVGYALVSKEKIEQPSDIYTMGIAIYSHVENIFGRPLKDENDLIMEIMHMKSNDMPDKTFTNPFKLKTGLGTFLAYESVSNNNIRTNSVHAVLKTKDNSYWINYEAPGANWASVRPLLEKIAKEISPRSMPREGELTVNSIYPN